MDIPKTAKMNMTRKRRRQMLIRAGKAMTSENNNVRIPFAPLIKRKTRPTFATIQSETYKNGIDITAPVVMVNPSKYIGAPMSSFKKGGRSVKVKMTSIDCHVSNTI